MLVLWPIKRLGLNRKRGFKRTSIINHRRSPGSDSSCTSYPGVLIEQVTMSNMTTQPTTVSKGHCCEFPSNSSARESSLGAGPSQDLLALQILRSLVGVWWTQYRCRYMVFMTIFPRCVIAPQSWTHERIHARLPILVSHSSCQRTKVQFYATHEDELSCCFNSCVLSATDRPVDRAAVLVSDGAPRLTVHTSLNFGRGYLMTMSSTLVVAPILVHRGVASRTRMDLFLV